MDAMVGVGVFNACDERSLPLLVAGLNWGSCCGLFTLFDGGGVRRLGSSWSSRFIKRK